MKCVGEWKIKINNKNIAIIIPNKKEGEYCINGHRGGGNIDNLSDIFNLIEEAIRVSDIFDK